MTALGSDHQLTALGEETHPRPGAVESRLRTDAATIGAYVSDASIFRRVPAAVFEPQSIEDIRGALLLARERGWPVTARGGGTSVAGNAIGEGLVIDTSRYFNRVLEIDPVARTARVEPGVVCDDLSAAAAGHGLTFGPDPSTHSRCTIGGMIGNNACGAHSLLWGTTADNIVELTIMRSDGELVTLARDGTSDSALDAALRELLDGNLAMLRTELGRFPRQTSGYGLHYLLPENGFDVAKAFVGTEGTCGIIVDAVVRLVERPAAVALVVLAFETIFDAAAAAPLLRRPDVATVEGMGGDLLDALRDSQGETGAEELLPGGSGVPRLAGGWLFCEVTGNSAEEAGRQADLLSAEFAAHPDHPTVAAAVVSDAVDMRRLWRIREAAAGLVTRLPDGREAWPSWEDSAVPPENLAAYLRDLYTLLDAHGLEGIPFGHFGEGCVHLRISFTLGTEQGLADFRAFMLEAASMVARHGGSLSGEHGDGRARSELLPRMYSTTALAAFSRFKHTFDPEGIFNPGVLIDPDPLDQDVRPGPGQRNVTFIPLHAFGHDGGSMVNAVNRCVGVGLCRSEAEAMCPSFQITKDEVHSTRGRARVLSEMFRGEVYPDGTDSVEVKEALDLCLSCHACASECPVNVDVSTLKSEFLNQHYTKRRRPMAHYSMGWLPWSAHLLGMIPRAGWVLNKLLGIRPIEKMVMRLGGVDGSRSMIRFAPRSFQSQVRGRKSGSTGLAGKVVLWPDSFSNTLDPAVLNSALEVLEALDYEVIVPSGFLCCGLTWHSTGQLEQAQSIISKTVDRLGDLLDGHTPIVCLEPSCASMLIEHAPQLLSDNPRVGHLSKQVVSLGEFLDKHRRSTSTWPFGQLNLGALSQVHCHERARGAHDGTTSVLGTLGIDEATIQTGCCGMAGNWGFEPGHAEMSRDLGERELFPRVRGLEDTALVLADGFSCRTQIREGTGLEGLHLAQVLSAALKHGPEADVQSESVLLPEEGQ